jgi:nitric oxide synthase oxygenase domain/subunit
MLAAYRRQNAATLIVFVDQTGTNQERFRDACERLGWHPKGTRQDVDTARPVKQQSEVLLFKEPQPEAVASF